MKTSLLVFVIITLVSCSQAQPKNMKKFEVKIPNGTYAISHEADYFSFDHGVLYFCINETDIKGSGYIFAYAQNAWLTVREVKE